MQSGTAGVDVDFLFEPVFLPIQIAPTLWLELPSLKCGPLRPPNEHAVPVTVLHLSVPAMYVHAPEMR